MQEILDENNNQQIGNAFIGMRLGLVLLILTIEVDANLGFFMNEFFITIGIDPLTNILLMELIPLLILQLILPTFLKRVKKLVADGQESRKNLLRNLTLGIVLSIIIYLINYFYISKNLPDDYFYNYVEFDNYIWVNRWTEWIYFSSYLMLSLLLAYLLKRNDLSKNENN